MFYDLHMHSCLSPCADDDMTPNNICNMAMLKGLELIALTDHNSCKQLPALDKVASNLPLHVLYGSEIQTQEEVHVLGIFDELSKTTQLQKYLDDKMPNIQNDEDYFGHQYVMNEKDEVIEKEDRLLLVSIDATIEEVVDKIHSFGGKVIIAHVMDRLNSITTQLGFIPDGLDYDGLEIKTLDQKEKVIETHPWISEDSTYWFIDSDAHRLIDISEADHALEKHIANELWGDHL